MFLLHFVYFTALFLISQVCGIVHIKFIPGRFFVATVDCHQPFVERVDAVFRIAAEGIQYGEQISRVTDTGQFRIHISEIQEQFNRSRHVGFVNAHFKYFGVQFVEITRKGEAEPSVRILGSILVGHCLIGGHFL